MPVALISISNCVSAGARPMPECKDHTLHFCCVCLISVTYKGHSTEKIKRRPNIVSKCVFAGVATILNRMQKANMTVAVEGSLYRYHPHFHRLLEQKVKELVDPSLKVTAASDTMLNNSFSF